MAEAIDYREPARDAIGRARLAASEAHPDDQPLIWATLAVAYAGMAIAGAIMTTCTPLARGIGRAAGELAGIRAELAKVNEAIR